jgi:hypothetical protein
MKLIKYSIVLFLLIQASFVVAQDYHFGIRAGLTYATFQGPVEADASETFGINNGFHFGIVGMLDFNDYFSLGMEVLYNQAGTNYLYEGESHYRMNVGNTSFLYDDLRYNLEITNSYVNIPLLLHFKPIKKLEFMVGGYMGFLINPVAGGSYEFGNRFRQYPEFDYYSDNAGGVSLGSQYEILNVKVPQPDGSIEVTQIHRNPGAYYHYSSLDFNDDTGNYYHWFDLGLTGGIQYFINSSLYAGVRVEYGFLDISNDKLDRSLRYLDADENYILRNDKDTNLNFQVSLGFRF